MNAQSLLRLAGALALCLAVGGITGVIRNRDSAEVNV